MLLNATTQIFMSKFSLSLFSILALSLSSCALLEDSQKPQLTPQLTPLEIQTLQTREYKAPKERVFASVMAAFQNLGYNIVSADQATGFINAKSLLISTAFVETIGNMTRVRLSFVEMTHGMTSSYDPSDNSLHYKKYEKQVLDATLYQNAFEQIDSELFVRSSH